MKFYLKKRTAKILFSFLFLGILFLNIVAFFHAYKFTHFTTGKPVRTKDPKQLPPIEKLTTLIVGISNPRPVNKRFPERPYRILKLKSNKEIECWTLPLDSAKGTVILFHGFSGEKSSLLDRAEIFRKLGYATVLVDFMGSGGSEGNQTTIGFFEAEQVKTVYEYVKSQDNKSVYLFGTSMGSAAIMRAVSEYKINPSGLILECPFGSMYKTVCARFELMNAPTFPMARLLVFWGGLQNRFWAFGHNPQEYAKNISCPTLLMFGELDNKVSREETDTIFANLKGLKRLAVYPFAGHDDYLDKYKSEWEKDVVAFLR
jgi:uncharacterized protein